MIGTFLDVSLMSIFLPMMQQEHLVLYHPIMRPDKRRHDNESVNEILGKKKEKRKRK